MYSKPTITIQGGKPQTQQKSPKLIGQGSYGCVFYPGITCSGKTENVQYVTKVQKDTPDVDKEKLIGDQIRKAKIKKYYDYFAPVISKCPLKLAAIQKDELNHCDVLQEVHSPDQPQDQNPEQPQPQQPNDQPQPNYVSVKIRYVGKQTLKEHLLERLLNDTPTFFGHLLETQLFLLQSLEKLGKAKVIHFDLKSNNIMFHEKIQNPVIIDFGMSIPVSELTSSNKPQYQEFFFDHYEKYPPWCVDIILVAYLVKNQTWTNEKITANEANAMQQIIETYYRENPVMLHIQSTTQPKNKTTTNPTKSQKHWTEWTKQNTKKTKDKVVTALLEKWPTWDTYSLVVLYYRFMKENVKMESSAPFVDSYLSLMESQIITEDRMTPKELHGKLKKFAESIPKKEYLQWNQKMTKHQKDPEVIQWEKESITKDQEENKIIENKLFQQKQKQKQ